MLFGKLPACGDFVMRGLLPQRQAEWDRWATSELAAAREALGAAFETAHDAAPPLAFRCAEDGGVYVVAPSIDGVGRRFVLMAGLTEAGETDADHVAQVVDEAIRYDLEPDAVMARLEEEASTGMAVQIASMAAALVPGLLLNHLTTVAAEIAS